MPEVWGGLECTVNRVGDRYFDQFSHLAHLPPDTVVDLIASLGIRVLRFPILWERVAPHGIADADWSWTDRALGALRRHGIEPIVGLVHHGSGPRETSLLDPRFPERLAWFAQAVAARYPWITRYTPVNEPLTTARFSALYGLWYPHAKDDVAFATALFNQCAAIARAMDAVRTVNPQAQLVQTEDLGKVYSTPNLAYQAELENLRRWSSLDLLCDRAATNGVLVALAERCGVHDFAPYVSPPHVLGFNYYVTGERFLDDRIDRYDGVALGSNGFDRYVDVEAARVCIEGAAGLDVLLGEAWERYERPLAVTESHLGCTRDEQLRWLEETWTATRRAARNGCDVRAFTVWALLGSHDWDRLLTAEGGHYEPGAFDTRSPQPRRTAIAAFVRSLCNGERFEHAVLDAAGWWRSPGRFSFPPVSRGAISPLPPAGDIATCRPLFVFGARAGVANDVAMACRLRSLPVAFFTRERGPVDAGAVAGEIDALRPWAVIDCDGMGDDATRGDDRVGTAAAIADATVAAGARLVLVSSDAVFDAPEGIASTETDAVSPATGAGIMHAAAERAVIAAAPDTLIVRAGCLFGFAAQDAVADLFARVEAGEAVDIALYDRFSAAPVEAFVHAVLDLLVDGESGTWHVASPEATSWANLLEAGVSAQAYRRIVALAPPGARGRSRVLASERGTLLAPLACYADRLPKPQRRAFVREPAGPALHG